MHIGTDMNLFVAEVKKLIPEGVTTIIGCIETITISQSIEKINEWAECFILTDDCQLKLKDPSIDDGWGPSATLVFKKRARKGLNIYFRK